MKNNDKRARKVCMIAYSSYVADARIKREAETLVKYGWDVSIIMLSHDLQKTLTQHNGVTCIPLNIGKYMGKGMTSYFLSYFLFGIKAMIKCTKLTLSGNVDVVHVHNMPNFLVFCALVPKLLGKKIVLDIHDSMIETYLGKFGKLPLWLHAFLYLEERLSSLFSDYVICVNHVQMKPLLKRGIPEKKMTVLLNVPDHHIFNAGVAAEPRKNEQNFNIVYHGTLDMALGIDIALRAIKLLKSDLPNILFHIIGGGKDQEYFRQLIEDLDISGHVSYSTDLVPVNKIPDLLKNMHVGIIPNRKNVATQFMLPVKMLEYISLKIPVVAPKLDTIRYYFNENAISFYEPEDVQDLAAAILKLAHDETLRKRNIDTASKILEQFGWEVHHADLINLYEKIESGK